MNLPEPCVQEGITQFVFERGLCLGFVVCGKYSQRQKDSRRFSCLKSEVACVQLYKEGKNFQVPFSNPTSTSQPQQMNSLSPLNHTYHIVRMPFNFHLYLKTNWGV